MGWGMEGRRVGGGRVVHSRGHSAVWRAHGRCPLYGGAAWWGLSEVLLEPFEQPAQGVEHALPELVAVWRDGDVLVSAPRAGKVREQEAAGIVLRR